VSPRPPILDEPNWIELLFFSGEYGNRSFFWLLRVIWCVFVHFLLSFHNGWIDPRLRLYERIEDVRDSIREEMGVPMQPENAEAEDSQPSEHQEQEEQKSDGSDRVIDLIDGLLVGEEVQPDVFAESASDQQIEEPIRPTNSLKGKTWFGVVIYPEDVAELEAATLKFSLGIQMVRQEMEHQ
jgi:hypothetical protein